VPCWDYRCNTGVCWGRCRHSSANYEARGASGGKYEAQIVIFCILAAVDRFNLGFLGKRKAVEENQKAIEENWKALAESRKALRKAERHCGKQKGVAESRKPLTKVGKPLRKIGKPLRKIGKQARKIGLQAKKIGFRARKIPIFPRDSLASGVLGVSFCYQICYHVRAWIYFVELKYSQLKINQLSDKPSTKGSWGRIYSDVFIKAVKATRRSSWVPFLPTDAAIGQVLCPIT
jgi:hypothetical protein